MAFCLSCRLIVSGFICSESVVHSCAWLNSISLGYVLFITFCLSIHGILGSFFTTVKSTCLYVGLFESLLSVRLEIYLGVTLLVHVTHHLWLSEEPPHCVLQLPPHLTSLPAESRLPILQTLTTPLTVHSFGSSHPSSSWGFVIPIRFALPWWTMMSIARGLLAMCLLWRDFSASPDLLI